MHSLVTINSVMIYLHTFFIPPFVQCFIFRGSQMTKKNTPGQSTYKILPHTLVYWKILLKGIVFIQHRPTLLFPFLFSANEEFFTFNSSPRF
uniref:Uncharacterized protein n=1 Tax=Octopus bimaculoides TaxID=37653 RepID=A0A0L8G1Y1_OCTBM